MLETTFGFGIGATSPVATSPVSTAGAVGVGATGAVGSATGAGCPHPTNTKLDKRSHIMTERVENFMYYIKKLKKNLATDGNRTRDLPAVLRDALLMLARLMSWLISHRRESNP
ncbi:hypothetical protein KA405_00165 [Patescibacteria group bacterium]|nr:hypothetical protein [Patescibacteria group bacterium]